MINYTDFIRKNQDKIVKDRQPIDGTLELTHRCNLNCVYCYCNLDQYDKRAISEELTTGEIYRILDQISDAGCLWILLTGGEPLLREDFLDIYLYAKKKGFLVTVFTNGTLLNEGIASIFKKYPPYKIEITLNGADAQCFERVTGKPGSFEDCLKGIRILLKYGLPLGLKSTITILNSSQLNEIKEFAVSRGLNFRFDTLIQPRIDGSSAPCKLRLSPEQVVALDIEHDERIAEYHFFCEKYIGALTNDKLFFCGAGVNLFQIDPYGRLNICEMARFEPYDLKAGNFSEGWNIHIQRMLDRLSEKHPACRKCDLISLCGQCPGWAYAENGSQEDRVDYLCKIARMRAEVLELQAVRIGG